jgi:two-component system, OmpR family, response regulator
LPIPGTAFAKHTLHREYKAVAEFPLPGTGPMAPRLTQPWAFANLCHSWEGYEVIADSDLRHCLWEPTTKQDGAGLHVLVVEDDPDTAESTALLLRLYGHQVQTAPDGPSALRAAQVAPPDVVLLDLGLPGMDGWKVAKRLGEQAGKKQPLLIAVTGYGREADQRRSLEAGIHLHLLKPVDPDFLRKLLLRFQAISMSGEDIEYRDTRRMSGRGWVCPAFA